MFDIRVPFSFLKKENIVLSAKEIDFAINHELIHLSDLSQIVDFSLLRYPDDKWLLELALNLLLNEGYKDVSIKHSKISCQKDNGISDKWRYIILLWLFVNRSENSSDYDKINSVYADFDYPTDMERFINYMPTQKKSNKSGYQNILDNWKDYLDNYKYLMK